MNPNHRPRRLVAAVAGAGLVASALVATSAPSSAAPAVPTAPAASAAKSSAPELRVMTVNLYLGGSLGKAISAANEGLVKFLAAAAEVYDTVQKTNFPKRANWIAKTIKQEQPDVLTLNELSTWIATAPAGTNLPSYDFLAILQKALKKKGLHYKVAALSPNADLGYSPTIGIPYINPDIPACNGANPLACQVRLKDSDAVLYNTDNKKLKPITGTSAHGNFATQETFKVAGTVLSFNRGWASAGFKLKGTKTTVITAHLEVESKDGQTGLYGPKNWPSHIQAAQGNELLSISKQRAKKTNGRVVLAGDLNTDANGYYSPTYGNLTKSYFKDSWFQVGKMKGPAVGATCCQEGTLNHSLRLDSGDPATPTRIDLVLNHKASTSWAKIVGTKKEQSTQPKWQSDHYFYAAHVTLK